MRLRRVAWTLALLGIAAGGAAAAFAARDPERRDLDDGARREAPGHFVRLADGMTHFEVAGPDGGRVVVLAAGFSVPAYIWDSLYQGLADSGFRVIRYDYFGRGWSDRPRTQYSREFFVRQLEGLLDSVAPGVPVDLAGLSYGGAIVTSFADRYPDRVRSLIYVDPTLPDPAPLPLERRSRLAWDVKMVLRGGTEQMAAGQTFDFLHPERFPEWPDRYRVQQQFRGTRAAVRATHLAIAAGRSQREQLRRVGAHSRPVLFIRGRQDRVVSVAESDSLRASLPRAAFLEVDSAGHLPHLERPDVVIPAVAAFLR